LMWLTDSLLATFTTLPVLDPREAIAGRRDNRLRNHEMFLPTVSPGEVGLLRHSGFDCVRRGSRDTMSPGVFAQYQATTSPSLNTAMSTHGIADSITCSPGDDGPRWSLSELDTSAEEASSLLISAIIRTVYTYTNNNPRGVSLQRTILNNSSGVRNASNRGRFCAEMSTFETSNVTLYQSRSSHA